MPKRPEQLNSCSGRFWGKERGRSLERDVQTGVDDIVVLPHFDNRGGVVDQAVGASDADGGRDVVLEIDGGAEAGFLEVGVRRGLVYGCGGEFPLVADLVSHTERKMALDAVAKDVGLGIGSRFGLLPLFVFVE